MRVRDESRAETPTEGRYAAARRTPRSRKRRTSRAVAAMLEATRPRSTWRHSTRRRLTSESELLGAARARMAVVRSWRAAAELLVRVSVATMRSTW
jgi:hypothetical protein